MTLTMTENPDTEKSRFCLCGCGQIVEGGKRFIHLHNKNLPLDHPSNPLKGAFQKGNTFGTGRPTGSRSKQTLAALNMIEGESESITRVALDLALAGDRPMIKLVLERLVPVAKNKPINISLPTIDDLSQVPELSKTILSNIATGNLSIEDGSKLSSICADLSRSFQVVQVDERLKKIESRLAEHG